MTIYYLDTSVALHTLLGHSPSAALWIDRTTADSGHRVVSSRILKTELTRVLRREQLPLTLRDELLGALELVPLTDGVLAAAEAIESHLTTLDALHLGSVIAAGLDAIIVSHDAKMLTVAVSLGYSTLDPVADS